MPCRPPSRPPATRSTGDCTTTAGQARKDERRIAPRAKGTGRHDQRRRRASRTTVATFTKSGLSVRVTCNEAMTGTATLTLSAKLRKQLRLKSATLPATAVKCAGAGSKTVKLKPSKAVQRALKKAKGSVKVTLGVSLRAKGEATKTATRAVTLSR